MDRRLRQRLASDGADEESVTPAILDRLIDRRKAAQMQSAWATAEGKVARHSGDGLLAIAPGEEILNAAFLRFERRGYSKRNVAVVRAMPAPLEEIRILLEVFMLDKPETDAAPQRISGSRATSGRA